MHLGANALKIFGSVYAGTRDFFCDGNVNFFAVPQHSQLLQHFDMLKRARLPVNIAANKTGAIAVNAQMAQKGVPHRFQTFGETIAIPWDGRA